ncbi:hypothetical protein ACRAWD_21060 [Caulobacter segnis]
MRREPLDLRQPHGQRRRGGPAVRRGDLRRRARLGSVPARSRDGPRRGGGGDGEIRPPA